nr:hypothetical protein [Tanacetum cinerariifolium]
MDVHTPTSVAPLPMSSPTITPSTITTMTTTQQSPLPPTTAPSTLLQDLPNFGSLFRFDNRLKTLEANFSEFMQTNQYAGAVSSIPGIVQRYMDQQMNEAVKTSYFVATDLSEMELKKILIEKMEGNKSIHRSNEQRNLYKALVEAYESDKIILDTYGDTVMLKRHHDDDADKDEEPFAGSDRGSKRRREEKEPELASTSASESATVKEPMQTTFEMEEPSHAEFEIGADDQPIVESTVDENIKKIIKEQVKYQVKVQVSKILPRIEQAVNKQLEVEVLTRSSYSSRTSYAIAADFYEMELKKILIEKMEGNKSIQFSDEQMNHYKALVDAYESDKLILDTYGEAVILKRRRDDDADKDEEPSAGPDRGSKRHREGKEPESASAPTETTTRSADRLPLRWKRPPTQSLIQKPPSLDRDWNKTLPAVHGSIQPWISKIAKKADSRSSFNELMDTPFDFSNFLINRLKVDTLTLKLLVGPTYELMNGSCKSLIELEYHMEEVYKATTDQLEWVNPEGQQYPNNLLHPLSLIPNNRGRPVIPFEHFINNDLEYLRGGSSSREYTTLVTKMKATDYGHIKWIEDLVPRTMWIQEPIDYDKHAL